MREIPIDFKLLKWQIKQILEASLPESDKEGLHSLLGTILDVGDGLKEGESSDVRITKRTDKDHEYLW